MAMPIDFSETKPLFPKKEFNEPLIRNNKSEGFPDGCVRGSHPVNAFFVKV